jgi:hypothetical protein
MQAVFSAANDFFLGREIVTPDNFATPPRNLRPVAHLRRREQPDRVVATL